MQYKLFSIDLDGTLLNKWKKISKKNIYSLKKYSDAGGNILINTGRSISSITKIISKLHNASININFISTLRGAYIINKSNNEITKSRIPGDIVSQIIDYCKKNKLVIWIYSDESIKKNNVFVSNYKICTIIGKIFRNLQVVKIPKNHFFSAYKINIMSIFKKKKHCCSNFFRKTIWQ
jgi:hydroxymethylpyrimidine pyrophosphatase-like HAD family hydrolase